MQDFKMQIVGLTSSVVVVGVQMRISSNVGRGNDLSSMYKERAVFRTWSEEI